MSHSLDADRQFIGDGHSAGGNDEVDYDGIPDVAADAVVDPNWLALRGNGLLPSLYMPPPMAREHNVLMRAIAVSLIGVFVLATTLGICLTYGPP